MEQLNVLAYAAPKEEPPRRFRTLVALDRAESRGKRLGMAVVAIILSVAFFWLVLQYWAPAHPGVDQSGYLMGGKQLAATGSTGLKPAHPLGFVSSMYVRNDDTGYNYPKYPVGLPLLVAIALWTCGDLGPKAAHLVSPIGMAMAVLGTYFLARRFAGTFASLAAMLILATSPVVLLLADNPNSHASCLAFCVWGAFFLVRFWETGSVWRGLLGGLFLGFAVTIRYPEGVFGAMIGLVVLATLPWTQIFTTKLIWRRRSSPDAFTEPQSGFRPWFKCLAVLAGLLLIAFALLRLSGLGPTLRLWIAGTYVALAAVVIIAVVRRGVWQALSPAIGWAIPVVALVVFNKIAMGTWTGYDTTNESVPGQAFTLDHFYDNWELFTRKVHDTGLFFALPLGVLGMVLAMRTSLRRGLLLWLWLVPGAAVYLTYYWAPENGLSYLRFLITLLPPLAVGVAVTLDTAVMSAAGTLSRIVTPLAVGAVVLVAASMGLYRGLLRLDIDDRSPISMESQLRQELNLSALADVVLQSAPKGSVLIAPSSQLHALQFLGHYECFDAEVFRGAYATRLAGEAERNESNPDDPNPIQPQRRKFLLSHIRGKNDDQLAQVQAQIVKNAIAEGRNAFVLTTNYNDFLVLQKRYGSKKTPIDGIEAVIANRYSELTRPKPEDAPPPPTDPRAARRGPNAGPPAGRPGRMFRAGQRQGNNANWMDNLPVQKWILVEIRKHVESEEDRIQAAKVRERVAAVAAAREKATAAAKEKAAAAAREKAAAADKAKAAAATRPATRPANKPTAPRPAATRPAATRPAVTPATAPRPSPPSSTRPATRPATTRSASPAPSPVGLNGSTRSVAG